MKKYRIKSRLYIDLPYKEGDIINIENEKAHYIKNVLRAKNGDILGIFNGKNGEYAVEITNIDKRKISLKILNKIKDQLDPEHITLLFSLIKKSPMDYILQKGTEVGCGHFQPVITDFTVIKDFNIARAEKITIEAAEQCGLTSLPKISRPISLEKSIEDYNHILFCNENGNGYNISNYVRQNDNIDAVLIGPEGGFSQKEHELLSKKDNIASVTMGKRIMRAETASIVALGQVILRV